MIKSAFNKLKICLIAVALSSCLIEESQQNESSCLYTENCFKNPCINLDFKASVYVCGQEDLLYGGFCLSHDNFDVHGFHKCPGKCTETNPLRDCKSICGNGVYDGWDSLDESTEQCDDGNRIPGDGCDENCQFE